MEHRLRELEQKIGYTFHDFSLLKRAMMHSSYTNEKHLEKYQCNERLESVSYTHLDVYKRQCPY